MAKKKKEKSKAKDKTIKVNASFIDVINSAVAPAPEKKTSKKKKAQKEEKGMSEVRKWKRSQGL
ncbi:hypothetical protein BH09BAC5_BH09BAC5_23840 [soil metagenome]